MSVGLNIKVEEKKGKTIVYVEGRIDATSAPIFEGRLAQLIDSGVKDVIVDFTKVEYLSSAGMRVMLANTKKMQDNGRLSFCSINDEVMEIIKMAGFEKILKIYPNEQSALQS